MTGFKRQLILPLVIVIIALYLIGLTVWINRDENPTENFDSSYIPVAKESETVASSEYTGEKININTATADELCELEKIGTTLAKRIIEKREELGGFTRLYQLMDVKGIGEDTYNKIKDKIKIE